MFFQLTISPTDCDIVPIGIVALVGGRGLCLKAEKLETKYKRNLAGWQSIARCLKISFIV